MLRLPQFRVAEPTSVAEAVALLAEAGENGRAMAGGTDLMPNMKHRIVTPELIVGLWRIRELSGVRQEGNELRIGALTTLHQLAEDPLVRALLPSLSESVALVAGPQLRRMGTIGGNVCLDTRCVYINQTHFWRRALGYCLKKDGTVCHVVKSGRRCVAAASNDSAPVLMSLGATLRFQNSDGERLVPISDFYVADGVFNQDRRRDDVLVEIRVPLPKPGTVAAYTKLRTRGAIDFPELGVAVLARVEDGVLVHADVCVNALAARPVHVALEPERYLGKPLDPSTIDYFAGEAYRRCKPVTNIASDPAYRREMVPVFVRRAFRQAMARV